MLRRPSKDQGIETLRGLAILLMVAGHVIGVDQSTGMRVGDDSPFRQLYYSTQFLRMPLFTVISGFVYSLRPVTFEGFSGFLIGKCRRILIPLVSVSTLQFFARVVNQDVNRPLDLDGLWKIYIYPFDHFWFLQSIFLIFVTVAVLDGFKCMTTLGRWLAVFSMTVIMTFSMPRFTGLFSFVGYLYLLPYFFLGCGLCRFPRSFDSRTAARGCIGVLIAAFIVQQFAWFSGRGMDLDRVSVLAMAIGIPAGILLVAHRFANPLLARIGRYSYGIYLFHVFGTAGCRILLRRIGVESGPIVFLASILSGVVWPIVFEVVLLSRVPVVDFLLLGTKPKRVASRV